jgi:phosphoribosylglycinamide formyltransferase-1
MRLLTPWFVDKWNGRLLNIHPAYFPLSKASTHMPARFAAGVKIHGATVHFVVPKWIKDPLSRKEQ